MINIRIFRALLLVGLIIAGAVFLTRLSMDGAPGEAEPAGTRKVAYWVAPMDPNYRRDEPGKSPMGMDLIPVYEDEAGADAQGPSIKIDASVINNIGVKTQKVRREDMVRRLDTVGSIMVDEEARADIHVRSEGWVEKLHVESVGENVARGELLFEIYAPALVAAQSEYVQALKIARPALIEAATERLNALGMSPDQIAQLKRSMKPVRLVGVYAPQPGVVMTIGVREGMFLRPGDKAMRLADLSTVWAIADIFETDGAWVAPGQHARMTLPAFPGEVWEGEVDYVYPTAEAMTRTVQVRARFANSGNRLKPNLYANISIDAAPKKGVLTIPQSALIRTSTGDRVIVALGEGRFRPARVVGGVESAGRVEVLSGLNEGEDVVVESQFLIDSEASLDPELLRLTAPSKDPDPMPAMSHDHDAGDKK